MLTSALQNFKSPYFEEHLQAAASENVLMKGRKINIYFTLTLHLKKVFSTSISETSESVCFYFMIRFP